MLIAVRPILEDRLSQYPLKRQMPVLLDRSQGDLIISVDLAPKTIDTH